MGGVETWASKYVSSAEGGVSRFPINHVINSGPDLPLSLFLNYKKPEARLGFGDHRLPQMGMFVHPK